MSVRIQNSDILQDLNSSYYFLSYLHYIFTFFFVHFALQSFLLLTAFFHLNIHSPLLLNIIFLYHRHLQALEYNGGAVLAMTGKQCVAIASDLRYGQQHTTVGFNFDKCFKMHDHLYVGMSGLATDIMTVSKDLTFKLNMYRMREEREIKPTSFCNMVCAYLYEKRFGPWFVEPIVAGLDVDNNYKPFIAGMDLIGAPVYTSDFVLSGTAEESMFGTCESLYRPDLAPEDLFETISQCLLAAVDRDCLSGWGAVVHVITKDGVTTKRLVGRMD